MRHFLSYHYKIKKSKIENSTEAKVKQNQLCVNIPLDHVLPILYKLFMVLADYMLYKMHFDVAIPIFLLLFRLNLIIFFAGNQAFLQ